MSLPNEPTRRFADRVAIVTGSGRGIGFQVASRMLAEGARVVLNDIDSDRLDAAADELSSPDSVMTSLTDVTNPAAVTEMIARTIDRFGQIDILANIAGGSYGAEHMRLMDFNLDDWRRIFDLNLTSAFLCIQAVVPAMRSQGGGAIVTVSSSAGVRGEPGLWSPPYCAAKAGVQGLTRQVALEYGHAGIRANCVAPGDVLSERTYEYLRGEVAGYFEDEATALDRYRKYPIPRFGEPSEQASVICFLASDDASYMTGETINVNGGFHVAP